MTLLNFIFHCGWHFAGFVVLLMIIGEATYKVAFAVFGRHSETCETDPDEIARLVLEDFRKNGPIRHAFLQAAGERR